MEGGKKKKDGEMWMEGGKKEKGDSEVKRPEIDRK